MNNVKQLVIRSLILFLILLLIPKYGMGDKGPGSEDAMAPRVFLDCDYQNIDVNFIKEEITFVHYVRDRQAADIHLIITFRRTGSGGREYNMEFIGLGKNKGNNRDLKFYSNATDSKEKQRQGLVKKLKQGFFPYISDTPMADFISISYSGTAGNEAVRSPVKDKWNNWSFRIGLSGDYDAEEFSEGYEYRLSLSANRVTRESKISIWAFIENEKNTYQIEDEGILEEFISETRRSMIFISYIKSLTNHWSLGGFFDIYSSTYDNADIYYTTGLGAEYNIFPYEDYTKRELRIQTKLEYAMQNYDSLTVFGLLKDNLFRQELQVMFALKEPWGSISLQLGGVAYYHDFSKNNFRGDAELRVNLIKGLTFHISGNYSRIRDQLSLPAEAASKEEILLEVQELATGYEMSMRLGLSYHFGSIFSNVVNPRFQRRHR